MIEKMTVSLIDKMLEEHLIDNKQREHYSYAIISMTDQFIAVGTIILLSIIASTFVPTLFFLIFFLSLRKRTGGYHANSFLQCYFLTIAIYLLTLAINTVLLDFPQLFLVLLLPASCIIGIIGTINHPNMHMDDQELAAAKKAARIMVILEGSIIYIIAFIGTDTIFVSYMSMAVILCAILLCIAKITKQEVGKVEGNQQKDAESN